MPYRPHDRSYDRPSLLLRRWIPLALGAGFLAQRAWAESRRTSKAERALPPRGRFVRALGVRLHVIDQGEAATPDADAPALVFLHGNGGTTEDWRISGLPQQAEAAGHRVLLIDRPGFGFSERPRRLGVYDAERQGRVIQDALDQLGVARAIVIGHSWGALVAVAMALAQPKKIAGLVLIGGYVWPEPRADVAGLLPTSMPLWGDVMNATMMPWLARRVGKKIARGAFAPEPMTRKFLVEFPWALAARPSQLRASFVDTASMTQSAARMARRYPTLSMPVAIVSGDADPVVPIRAHSEKLHRAIEHSSLHVIEGGGHMVHHTVPGLVWDAVEEVIEAVGVAED
jgi:pimeloyl-ACP methyl ester carboxylesterase